MMKKKEKALRSSKTFKSYGRAFKGAFLLVVFFLLTGFTWNDVAPVVNMTYTINGSRVTRDVTFSPDASGKLFYDDINGELFNVSTSTITGYVSGENNISFRTYQTPTQQISGYTSYDLTNIQVNSVQNFKFYSKTSNMNVSDYALIVIMVLLGISFLNK